MLLSPWILICLDVPMSKKGDSKIFLPYSYKPQLRYSQKTVSVSLSPFLWENNVHWAWRGGWILHHLRQCKPQLRGKTKLWYKAAYGWRTHERLWFAFCQEIALIGNDETTTWWGSPLLRATVTDKSSCHSKLQGTISIRNQLQCLAIITDGSRLNGAILWDPD